MVVPKPWATWILVATKISNAFKALPTFLALFYGEGRTALLEYVRAKTDLLKLAVSERREQIAFDKANKYCDLMLKFSRIKDREARRLAEQAIPSILRDLVEKPLALPGPDLERVPIRRTQRPHCVPPRSPQGRALKAGSKCS
jgi:hypothetical protein